MRRLHGIVLVLVAVFALSGGLIGQEKKDAKVKGVLPANWGKLGLTDEQKQKVYKVQADFKDKLSDLEKQVADLKAKEKDDLYKVLSDEQRKRLKDILAGKLPGDDKKDDKKEEK